MDLNRTKRIIYLIVGVLVLGLLGFLIYSFYSPAETPKTPRTEGISGRLGTGGLSGAGEGETLAETGDITTAIVGRPEETLVRLADFPVISPALNSAEDRVIYYKKDGGDLFSSDFGGEKREKISNLTILGLTEAVWSKREDRAAVFYLDGETLKGFLHLATSSIASLPQNLKGLSWSPDGGSLAYLAPNEDRLNLIVADSSARGPRTIFTTPILDLQLNWVTQDKFALNTAPSGLAEGYIFTFQRASGAFTRILGPFFGLTSSWSPDGSRILAATTDRSGGDLRLTVHDSTGKTLLAVTPPTLPEKCAWLNSSELFCAVPSPLPSGVVWPDDYLRGELNTGDRVISLDLEKKEIKEVMGRSNFDIANLTVTKDRSNLFFVNRKDGTLWSLKIR